MQSFRAEVESTFRELRDRIVAGLQELEALEGPARFERTPWSRPGLEGGGEMSVLRGQLFEKGGCNFSAVGGERYPAVVAPQDQPDRSAERADAALGISPPTSAEIAGKPFFATGVSLVVHPRNPYVPIVHLNVRYLEVGDTAWFGGGADLTPCKPFPEDTAHFHAVLQQSCNKQGGPSAAQLYPRFSRWAREYFFIPHRGSERGVGGIFFDYLRGDRARDFSLVSAVGNAFLPAYDPIVRKRRATAFTAAERAEQLNWRGRYVEFNLVYDRGTLFGLKSGGNVDAIFMSLPPLVSW